MNALTICRQTLIWIRSTNRLNVSHYWSSVWLWMCLKLALTLFELKQVTHAISIWRKVNAMNERSDRSVDRPLEHNRSERPLYVTLYHLRRLWATNRQFVLQIYLSFTWRMSLSWSGCALSLRDLLLRTAQDCISQKSCDKTQDLLRDSLFAHIAGDV